jgi:hypothetical protein
MSMKSVAKKSAKFAFYGVTGVAGPSILKTVDLLKKEGQRTAASTRRLNELTGEAWRVLANKGGATLVNEPFEDAMDRHQVDVRRAYLSFLVRKRSALACACVFVLLGAWPLLHGHLSGFIPLLLGGGLCSELAWLAEFRLWQLRGHRLSKEENGLIRDFWMEPGAWMNAFNPEHGFGLNPGQQNYRRWLWLKRVGLATVVMGALAAVDLFFSRSRGYTGDALCVGATGLIVAMLVEFHLRSMRGPLSRRAPALALFRFETGACYEEQVS